ncbi:hypothetical protein PTTG_05642, partial [Puccinia triticina 1-1 BBBD Race 1]
MTHTSKPTAKNYPLIADIDNVVPEPATSVVPVPHGTKIPPCSLQMVRWIGGAAPAFDSYPFCFTIPGRNMGDAHYFAKAMKATVCWTMENCFHNVVPEPPTANQPKKRGPPFKHYFKLYFACPRRGYHKAPINSRKAASSRKCGCNARFEITHHIATDTL